MSLVADRVLSLAVDQAIKELHAAEMNLEMAINRATNNLLDAVQNRGDISFDRALYLVTQHNAEFLRRVTEDYEKSVLSRTEEILRSATEVAQLVLDAEPESNLARAALNAADAIKVMGERLGVSSGEPE